MGVKARVVVRLLSELAEKANANLDFGGFRIMEEYLENGITQKYLDDTFRKAKRAVDHNRVQTGSRSAKLSEIAKGLGYKSFHDFEFSVSKPVNPLLKNCVGLWWSMVRGSSGDSILKSPVKIRINEDNEVQMVLHGEDHKYKGKVQLSSGCLFCSLDSPKGRKMHIILKASVNEYTRVLQGIFSGISSTGDPIGGRELFVRESYLKFDEMKWAELPLPNDPLDHRISAYFSDVHENCIRIDNKADLG